MKKIKAVDILTKSIPFALTPKLADFVWLKDGGSFKLNSIEFLNVKISNANWSSNPTLATLTQKLID